MTIQGPVPVKLCTKESEVVRVGPITIYLFEDGTNTDNRIGCMTLELPKGASGPPMHWHRFHDECFLVTKGIIRFITPEGYVDASEGDLMVVPPRAIHTFVNPSDTQDAEFFMTSTPGYYMDYFRMISKSGTHGKRLTASETSQLMALFGTFPEDMRPGP